MTEQMRWPAIVLVVVSTVVWGMLFGPFLWTEPLDLPMGLAVCGPAPLLIREVVRRRGGGWPALMMFGAGFGAAQYALVGVISLAGLQNVPGGLHYGEPFCLTWVSALGYIAMYAVWAITLPILLTELVFGDRRSQPWLRRTGIVAAAAVLVVVDSLVICAIWALPWAIDRQPPAFPLPVRSLGVAVMAAVLLAAGWWSTTALRGRGESVTAPAPAAAMVGLVALAGSSAWLGINRVADGELPIPAVLLCYLLLLMGGALLIRRWLSRTGFDDRHRLACYAGALAGYVIDQSLMFRPTGVDLAFDVAVCVVAVVLLWRLGKIVR
ncbi:hypothetical protein ABZ942_34345 [Nocardia sp. NPDC046473]|uniref:hypothetical protein n=1 Tax=Nocardia sp. NPDC046473 TaxID=3155733 RepID=UPI00340215EE